MPTVVVVSKLKKKDAKLSEMFQWCVENCHIDSPSVRAYWGTTWWTENGNTEFHFLYEEDAIMFTLRF